MEKNGFIASSLLYGMLALFLVLMFSTLAIFANNKLSMDKLKSKAFSDLNKYYNCNANPPVQYSTLQECTAVSGANCKQSCP